jgi:serine/threonine protein kinase
VQVKVLDFGPAKAAGSTPDLTQSPTSTVNHTSDSVVTGTPGYMSPEQARGQAVDKSTDIWAFGCVLSEMLTARVAFKGGTVSDTIAAVLESEPQWDALPHGTPASRWCPNRLHHRRSAARVGHVGSSGGRWRATALAAQRIRIDLGWSS